MNTKCYSVRLQSLTQISEKCYKATAYDGSSDLIPASQVFGRDYEVEKSQAWWISSWILSKKNLQYSNKKEAWFGEDGCKLPTCTVTKHAPEKVPAVANNEQTDLKR